MNMFVLTFVKVTIQSEAKIFAGSVTSAVISMVEALMERK